MIYTAYAGTCSVRGSKGIYRLYIDTDKPAVSVDRILETVNGSYQCLSPDGKCLYTVHENMTFCNTPSGGVSAFDISGESPEFVNQVPSAGQLPCHISISGDGRRLYVSSYLNGWSGIHTIASDGSVSEPVAVIKHQETNGIYPSVHCIRETLDGKYICVVDVTLHRIMFYETESGKYGLACGIQLEEPYDYRPRQIVFADNYLYLITEYSNEIRVFAYTPQEKEFLHELQRVSLCDGIHGNGVYGACIRHEPNFGMIAGSVRGINRIGMYRVMKDGRLSLLHKNDLRVNGVRDFNFSPDGLYVLAAGQISDEVRLYRVDGREGRITDTGGHAKIPSCTCLTFVDREV